MHCFALLSETDPNLRHVNHKSLHAPIPRILGHFQTRAGEAPVVVWFAQAGLLGTAKRRCAAYRPGACFTMHRTTPLCSLT